MKNISKITISIIMFIVLMCFINTVSAANLSLNINFNGKEIKMTSDTPDMSWSVDNLLPGNSDETLLTIKNTGTRDVDVTFIAKVESGEELADILNIKIIKLANNDQKTDKELFDGKYSELTNLELSLEKGKTQKYKIITSLSKETGNEFQNKECKVKLSFIAEGEGPEQVVTDKVEEVQTGETRTIYKVIAVVVVAFVILLVTFFVGKKKEKEY